MTDIACAAESEANNRVSGANKHILQKRFLVIDLAPRDAGVPTLRQSTAAPSAISVPHIAERAQHTRNQRNETAVAVQFVPKKQMSSPWGAGLYRASVSIRSARAKRCVLAR
eukprot:284448-Rhodomonas_salina.2